MTFNIDFTVMGRQSSSELSAVSSPGRTPSPTGSAVFSAVLPRRIPGDTKDIVTALTLQILQRDREIAELKEQLGAMRKVAQSLDSQVTSLVDGLQRIYDGVVEKRQDRESLAELNRLATLVTFQI